MTGDKELESKVSKLLEGKTILTAEISSYDGLIEIDQLTFADGSSIRFGLPLKDGIGN